MDKYAKYSYSKVGSFGLQPLSEAVLDSFLDSPIKSTGAVNLAKFLPSFYKDSVKYRSTAVREAARVRFSHSKPTFSVLSDAQKNWYFYWRGQAVDENFIDTDISYLWLFIFELMNYGFEPDPDSAVALLIRVYEGYRDKFPQLNRDLPGWIGDLFSEGGRDDLALEWYARSGATFGEYANLDKYNSPEQFVRLGFAFWKKHMIAYPFDDFYLKHAKVFNRAFEQALEVANAFYSETEEETLLDRWFPKRLVEDEEKPRFAGAVISKERAVGSRRVLMRSVAETAYEELDALARYVENLVCAAKGWTERLAVEEEQLPEGLRSRLKEQPFAAGKQKKKTATAKKTKKMPEEMSLPSAPPMPTLELDSALIAELQQDSDVIRDLLLIEETPADTTQADVVVAEQNPQQMDLFEMEQPVVQSFDFNPLSYSIGGNETSQSVEALIDELTDKEITFLQMVSRGGATLASCRDFAKKNGFMLGSFVDGINEKAIEHLGDSLIEEVDDAYTIAEDFAAAVHEIIKTEETT